MHVEVDGPAILEHLLETMDEESLEAVPEHPQPAEMYDAYRVVVHQIIPRIGFEIYIDAPNPWRDDPEPPMANTFNLFSNPTDYWNQNYLVLFGVFFGFLEVLLR